MSILKVGMYASQSRSTNYLTFSSNAPFSIKFNQKSWDGVLEYSLDAQHWYEWDASEINSVDNTLYLRGSGNSYITGTLSASYAMQITATSGVECTGNIMSLLNHRNPDNAVMANAAFSNLFYGQDKLITSPDLPATVLAPYCYSNMFRATGIVAAPDLPATVLAPYCYSNMFRATGIVAAPDLPATVLADSCYRNMLYNCTNLMVATELPATTLADSCYRNMLYGCTSLTEAPELPATTLAANCYDSMLYGCTGIKISSTQTGIYQKPWRIPTVGTGTTATDWNNGMLLSTGGTFTGNPTINTTYYQAD